MSEVKQEPSTITLSSSFYNELLRQRDLYLQQRNQLMEATKSLIISFQYYIDEKNGDNQVLALREGRAAINAIKDKEDGET